MEFGEFWQRFTAAERASRVHKFVILDTQMWPVMRLKLFYALAVRLGVFNDPHPAQERPDFADTPAIDFSRVPKVTDIVVPFRRKVNGLDPYSHDIVNELRELSAPHLVIEHADGPDSMSIERIRHYGRQAFDDSIGEEILAWRKNQLRRWHGLIPRISTPQHYRDKWAQIITCFSREFETDLSEFETLPIWRFRRYLAAAQAFENFFKSTEAKRLFIVNAAPNSDVVLGAKRAGLKVIELQHGFISPMHRAYSYPRSWRIDAYPDEVAVWGEYWATQLRPPRNTRIRVLGPTSQFIETLQRLTRNVQATTETALALRKGRLIFTSQGALSGALLDAALKFAEALPDFKIIYRLHPDESLKDYEASLARYNRPDLGNLEFSHKQPIFLELLGTAEYVVGGFSTTLFEAVALGLKVISLKLPGHEHLRSAIQSGDMVQLDPETMTAQDIREAIRSASAVEHSERYYAASRKPYFSRSPSPRP